MGVQSFSKNFKWILATFVVIFVVLLACSRAVNPGNGPWSVSGQNATSTPPTVSATDNSTENQSSNLVRTRAPGEPILTPTPDSARTLPALRLEIEQYVVKAGDTLGQIARLYNIPLDSLIEENGLINPNLLSVGQILQIPAPVPGPVGSSFKILPDSELVYGPATVNFNTAQFIQDQGGYLARYREEVDKRELTGAQIVERISYEYSVNPRLILALIEYQSGWVTRAAPDPVTFDYPLGYQDGSRKGLYRQLAWAANNLNLGYYLWRVNGIGGWLSADGSIIPVDPSINAGTAGVQLLFSLLYDRLSWDNAVSESGLFRLFSHLFGYPFDYAVEPLLPPNLSQPTMQLPFEPGKAWSYTGGPHGGWGSGSAWAGLDFAPPGPALGCVTSEEWVVAVADGVILRAGDGAVVQDLHGDGLEQTGWTVLYMHIETRDRVQPGAYVRAGERIGHPSCEGGFSTGTHLHLARRYNGEWIPADQDLPFVLDGWISRGAGREYNGYLDKDGITLEARAGRFPNNAIQR
jgi:LasA protease